MDTANQGLMSENMTDVPVDAAASVGALGGLSEAESEELKIELVKVEEEISTLRQVLFAKEKHASEIKRKLGLTPFNELKDNFSKSWQNVQTSNAYTRASGTVEDLNKTITQSEVYKKTQETLSQAGQKTSAVFLNVSSAISKKLEDMKNTPTFKSFEGTVENLKSKVVGTEENTGGFNSPPATSPNAEMKSPQDSSPF
ncbi:tumor protein D54 [Callorhinchus milii]|uniref:Tumor protein D52-like 2 isoform 1 n=1 Tax=Callorhinchus milii TaxID=7868 RepID=K4FRK8_CALMI|nr:tumor protein D54 [Callorhinchus milii]AFK10548.1 tumor protein D52-like 2 isoform 1 [Callorhinchus milii]